MTSHRLAHHSDRRSDIEPRIGPRLRAARLARGLTLQQVATTARLSTGYLSRLERNDVSPSVASLITVCEILGLRVGELFDRPTTSIVRAGEGRPMAFGGSGAAEHLVSAGPQRSLEVLHSVIRPGGSGGSELYTLDCDAECAYVLRGVLTIVLDTEEHRLGPGDTMTFPGRTPHTWRNDDTVDVEVIWILAPAP